MPPPPTPSSRPSHPLVQLLLFRIRALYREPSALFWIFAFPLLISVALGIAFRDREPPELSIAVADGPGAEELARTLEQAEGLRAQRATLREAEELLRRGRVALVVVPPGADAPLEMLSDPTQAEGRTARLLAKDALERARGRKDTLVVKQRSSTAPGSRYIDFLIPGLLGFGLMSTSLWGMGWPIVQMRIGKLMKRLIATPMNRAHFLLSFMGSRVLLAFAEIVFYIIFARLLFDVRVFGSTVAFVLFALLGAMSFAGLGLFIASRAANLETASGLMNLIQMPMLALSGVFFSASNFPPWMQLPLKVLPLTALNDGLRAIMIDGAALSTLTVELGVLILWGGLSFVLALRFFRWQ